MSLYWVTYAAKSKSASSSSFSYLSVNKKYVISISYRNAPCRKSMVLKTLYLKSRRIRHRKRRCPCPRRRGQRSPLFVGVVGSNICREIEKKKSFFTRKQKKKKMGRKNGKQRKPIEKTKKMTGIFEKESKIEQVNETTQQTCAKIAHHRESSFPANLDTAHSAPACLGLPSDRRLSSSSGYDTRIGRESGWR